MAVIVFHGIEKTDKSIIQLHKALVTVNKFQRSQATMLLIFNSNFSLKFMFVLSLLGIEFDI